MRSRRTYWWSMALATLFAAVSALGAGSAQAAVGFEHLGAQINSSTGEINRQAGAHPDVSTSFWVERAQLDEPASFPKEQLHNFAIDLPPGLVGNPLSQPRCSENRMSAGPNGNSSTCPPETQVGIVRVYGVGGEWVPSSEVPVYNLEPPDHAPALFAFNYLGNVVLVTPTVRATDQGITMDSGIVSQGALFFGARVVIWGVPSDPIHDPDRWVPLAGGAIFARGGASPAPQRPLLSSPTSCPGTANVFTGHVEGWMSIGDFTSQSFNADENGFPFINEGCEHLPFSSAVSVNVGSRLASSPTGVDVKIDVPQTNAIDLLSTAHVRDVTVTFPEGMSVSASSAVGLTACTAEQIGLRAKRPPACPDSSKLGTVVAKTPLLENDLTGEVFLGEPYENKFGSLIAMYMTLKGQGVEVKLAGRADLDPETGQVTATFKNNPQLPFSSLTVTLPGADNSALVSPRTCGSHPITAEVVSWASPDIHTSSSRALVDRGCGELAFNPRTKAGVTSQRAGGSSSFAMVASREDRSEEFASVQEITLPRGLLGRVASVALCGDEDAAKGTCPEESRVGHVQVAAGVGSAPLWVPQAGRTAPVFLTGPYKGGPYGLSISVPSQAGPFDLGWVVVRTALQVDSRTAQITTGVDESRIYNADGSLDQVIRGAMPTTIKGIPLLIKELRVLMDREGFMVNPTNCSEQEISAEMMGARGSVVTRTNRFQVGDCAALGFEPRFSAKILDRGRRSTLRSWHPRTRFTVTPKRGDANIGGARVVLPSSTLLDQANIGTTCTRARMAARNCPAASIVGYAKAWSPLLRKAVEGPVYLAANGGVRPLPDLAAVLDGEIRVVLQGEVSTLRTGGKARLQNTFRVVPDAPVRRFTLTMRGGKKRGLLVNSTDLCRSGERGVAVFRGQNGRTHKLRPRIVTSFKGCGKIRRQAARRRAA